MQAAKETFLEIRELAKVNDDIIGFVLTGSRGKGFETQWSDYDFAVFVKDEALEKYQTQYKETPHGVRLYLFTLDSFAAYAAWDNGKAWDRYTWAHLTVEFDRSNSKIKQLLDEKARVPAEQVTAFIRGSLRYYINQVYQSIKCLRMGNMVGHRLEAAEGIKPFLHAVFCLHNRRLVPFYKYLEWELETFPLTKLNLSKDELLQALHTILETGDCRTQQMLLREAERMFIAEGHTAAFQIWDKGYKWALSFSLDA